LLYFNPEGLKSGFGLLALDFLALNREGQQQTTQGDATGAQIEVRK